MNLSDRALVEISGSDSRKLLQGLVTNDINKASNTQLIYAVMLNAQGRFLYDFFIFERDEKLLLDCLSSRRDEIIKKLNFYKLRAAVEIKKNDELFVAQNLAGYGFIDPRHTNLGYRFYGTKSEIAALEKNLLSEEAYHFLRIQNKIPESENDLTYEKSFILEFGFDELNAISYEKGCYVGQELTARTHYKGEIRKKIFHIKIPDLKNLPSKGSEISCEGKSIGTILSAINHQGELHALALIRLPDNPEEKDFIEKLEFENKKILVVN